jgi:hypothetical protein
MKKNEKLDTLRADIAQIFHAIEKLTRRVDAVVVPAPKKAKKVRKRMTVQARPASVQPNLTDQDEDENAASVSS